MTRDNDTRHPRSTKPWPSNEASFWAKVERLSDDECWPWLAYKDDRGYGYFALSRRTPGGQRSVPAYVFAYRLLIGPVPDGLEPHHLCEHPWCCNPFHLKPMTHRENMLMRSAWDAGAGGRAQGAKLTARTHCANGHEWSENARNYGGRGRQCRECKRIHAAKRYRENADRINARSRELRNARKSGITLA